MSKKILTPRRRGQPFALLTTTLVALLIASTPVSVPAYTEWRHYKKINSLEYKQKYGFWEKLTLPEEFRLNTIHAAALPTGKILLVAGSGNKRDAFDSYNNDGVISVLKTVVFNPETNHMKLVTTPSDLFCSGHALLQNGNLLIAGGTSGYELLEGAVKKPAGTMILHNEDPDSKPRTFKRGTKFTSPNGKTYVSTQDVILEPASKMDHGAGNVMIHHSAAKVFVEATSEDPSYVTSANEQYMIEGLKGKDVQNIYGQGGPMTLKKQDFRGDNKSYEFDPISEEYIRVGDLKESRWYATLPVLTNGDVLAVSGLDITGQITETTERYNSTEKRWSWGPNLAIPTYPALFRTKDPSVLFYSGSSAGYGPADKGRLPGFWNVDSNTFQVVNGLRDLDILETSGSVFLPPKKGSNDGSQSNRIMLVGGGGVGESNLVTDRTDIIDIDTPNPEYKPGPDLPEALRYINLTVTPWDEVFANGGTKDYRSKGNSYSHKTFSINPTSNQITKMADEPTGRGYHSGSLLLKDGRILVFGDDPLFGDKNNSTSGTFNQSIEIFTPPQFFRGKKRPSIVGNDLAVVQRGQQLTFKTDDATDIKTARLIPPSTATHVTNIEQRSVGAVVTAIKGGVTVDLPLNENVLPNGWYMLFVTNSDDIPSTAKMIKIVR